MKHFIIGLALTTSLNSWGQHDYGKAQHLTTYFLGAQRCGNTQSWIHGACHLQDGQKVGKDLTGGWHDCGDNIKFHHTGPFAALMYLAGYDHFPESYADNYSQAYSAPPGNNIPDILDEVKIETDYLIKCVDNGTAYWQISNGADHNSFSEPVTQSGETANEGDPRSVLSTTEGHSNALGNAASALALMSIVYKTYDSNYANSCLAAAQEYYNIAKINAIGTEDPDDFYGGQWGLATKDYEDEMGLAAIYLYRATNLNSYLNEAINFETGFTNTWDDFYYGNVAPLLWIELYQATNTQSYLNKVKSKVDGYSLTSCGYYHSTNWGSLPFAGNAAFLASLYYDISEDQNAYDFVKSNIDFTLGSHGYISADAPANFSFLIGYNELGGGYPQHPHHAAAFGKTSNAWGQFTTESGSPGSVAYAHELTGGLAGGPEGECSNFTDNIGNYVSSEYCIYYASGFLGAVAEINRVENNLITNISKEAIQTLNPVKISYMAGNRLLITHQLPTLFMLQSISGETVQAFKSRNNSLEIDMSSLASGVYLLKEQLTGETTKVIKL